MQAATKTCIKEELTRENAVEQIDCINKAKVQAGYESRVPAVMQIIEQDILADRASAIEYAEGRISKAAYVAALAEHWAEALRVGDEEDRAINSEQPITHA
jgi:hypothetical protein